MEPASTVKYRVRSKQELEGHVQEDRRWKNLSTQVSEIEAGVHKLEKTLEKNLEQQLVFNLQNL